MPRLVRITVTSATPRIRGKSDYIVGDFPAIYREARRMKVKLENFLHMNISARYTQDSQNTTPTIKLIIMDCFKITTRTIAFDDAGDEGTVNRALSNVCRSLGFEIQELDQIEVTFTRDPPIGEPPAKRAKTSK